MVRDGALATFSEQFKGDRESALERTFIVVLEKQALTMNWGETLETPRRPILRHFFDDQTGKPFPVALEGKGGVALPSPRFSREVRRIVETMADRVVAMQTPDDA